MPKSVSDRIIVTPSAYAKEHYLYLQEVGFLRSTEPHISRRANLNSYLLFVVITGKGTLTYKGQSYELKQGSCVWIHCQDSYSHESSKSAPWELKWVHFHGKSADAFYRSFQNAEMPFVFQPPNLSDFNEALSILLSLHKENQPLKELLTHKYLTDLIAFCFQANSEAFYNEGEQNEKLPQVRTYLEHHFSEHITLEQLSSLFFISKFHLAREYKRVFGTTLIHDLTALRISNAKSLLRFSSDSVEDIALKCGFQNAAYFIRVFRSSEGMTPLAYRRSW